jgi:hypothetical protein
MAAQPAAEVTFTLLDETGSRASMSLSVPYATLAADAEAAADALNPLIQAVTGCAIIGQSVTYSKIETDAAAPAAGSRVERKGVFVLRAANAKTVSYSVPGVLDALIKSTGQIDEDEANAAALVAALVDGANPWSDSNGGALTSLVKAYERYRRSTRAMLPSKKEPDPDAVAGN